MDEDKFALVEKILKDVHNVLTKNSELCSFDIVPVESNFRNKSPVLHIENCLGLESWCVKHVYMYCYTQLMEKYFCKPKHKALKVTSLVSDELTKLLNVTLLLNPELAFLWNKRREMVQQALLDKPSELRFAKVLLSRKPKCNDAFSYRRWILDDLFKKETHQNIQTLVNEELHICQLASDKSQNNYHSWSHRTWIIIQLTQTKDSDLLHLLFIKEYNFSERWMAKHVSDFSCYHYRQFCIRNIYQITNESYEILKTNIDSDLRRCFVRVLVKNLPKNSVTEDIILNYSDDTLVNFILSYPASNCSCLPNSNRICKKIELLFYELVLNDELIRFYKHHETLWYHRRFIIHEIIIVIYEYFGVIRQKGDLIKNSCKCSNQKQAKIVKYDCSIVYSTVLFNVIKNNENKFIDERRLDSDNYADRHEKYLKFVEGLNNVM